MKNIAIVCAAGIGDALITSIAAHSLRQNGFKATVFSPHLMGFGDWLEKGEYLPYAKDWGELCKFDAVLLQHDNTARARSIVSFRERGLAVFVFYTNYRFAKHGPLLEGFDWPFNEKRSMVANTREGVRRLFGLETDGRSVLAEPPQLEHRKYAKRVLIHPTSTLEEKNWLKPRYLKLARLLERRGFEPLFILSPEERGSWPKELTRISHTISSKGAQDGASDLFSMGREHCQIDKESLIEDKDEATDCADLPRGCEKCGLRTPHFETLGDLASTVYESGYFVGNDSGPAHLASYLSIPLAVICQGKQMPLWSPGWLPPLLIRPPRWVPNIKGMRLREEKWKYFITTKRVLNKISKLLKLMAKS